MWGECTSDQTFFGGDCTLEFPEVAKYITFNERCVYYQVMYIDEYNLSHSYSVPAENYLPLYTAIFFFAGFVVDGLMHAGIGFQATRSYTSLWLK